VTESNENNYILKVHHISSICTGISPYLRPPEVEREHHATGLDCYRLTVLPEQGETIRGMLSWQLHDAHEDLRVEGGPERGLQLDASKESGDVPVPDERGLYDTVDAQESPRTVARDILRDELTQAHLPWVVVLKVVLEFKVGDGKVGRRRQGR